MLSKIFLSVVLLTCVYTHTLESIKDNKDTYFQELPDNFNYELNEIQTLNPNLKEQLPPKFRMVVRGCLKLLFGNEFLEKLVKNNVGWDGIKEIFSADVISKFRVNNTLEGQKKVFESDIKPQLIAKEWFEQDIHDIEESLQANIEAIGETRNW